MIFILIFLMVCSVLSSIINAQKILKQVWLHLCFSFFYFWSNLWEPTLIYIALKTPAVSPNRVFQDSSMRIESDIKTDSTNSDGNGRSHRESSLTSSQKARKRKRKQRKQKRNKDEFSDDDAKLENIDEIETDRGNGNGNENQNANDNEIEIETRIENGNEDIIDHEPPLPVQRISSPISMNSIETTSDQAILSKNIKSTKFKPKDYVLYQGKEARIIELNSDDNTAEIEFLSSQVSDVSGAVDIADLQRIQSQKDENINNNENKNENENENDNYDGWKVGDYGLIKGEKCQIISFDFSSSPPSVSVKMLKKKKQVDTQLKYLKPVKDSKKVSYFFVDFIFV